MVILRYTVVVKQLSTLKQKIIANFVFSMLLIEYVDVDIFEKPFWKMRLSD
jgi:hypothetical protein